MASSSTHVSYGWVSFSPYGETAGSKNNSNRSKAGDRPVSSGGWSLDESMNDIEQQTKQQRGAMVVMERQMEDIDGILSNARGRSFKSKHSSPISRLSMALRNKNTRYLSLGDDDDDADDETCAVAKFNHSNEKLHKNSIIRILPPRNDDGSFPIHVSGNTSTTTAKFPPIISQSERNSYSSPRIIRQLPAFTNDKRPHHKNQKYLRSSFTWDESEDSQRSSWTSNEEESNKSRKSKVLKVLLVALAIVLMVSIGFVLGQWAQQVDRSKSEQQIQQQVSTPTVSPVVVFPTDANGDSPEDTIEATDDSLESADEKEDSHAMDPINESTPPKEIADLDFSNEPNSEVITYDYTAKTDFLVGVYYYPWHGANFHNGDGYMRKDLEPRHIPALGEYNDSDPGVISHHMKWFRQANIGLLVTSWWGPNRLEDKNTKDVIMEHEDVGNLKIALHYETSGRIGKQGEKLSNAKPDIKYMCENYFDHPNYYKLDDRPVLFIYISRYMDKIGILEEALLTMRSTASKCGHNLYLIGDSAHDAAPDPNKPHLPFWYFDAVTNYDVYGSSGRPEGHMGIDAVDNYYRNQAEWKAQAIRGDCRYVPAVSPGYNDRGVRMQKDHPPTSRRITSTSKEGSLFHYQLKQAKEQVDSKLDNMILVNSFNEWHEDTQIEPVIGDPATEPFTFTKGLEYVGYGELYLDILGAATSKDTTQHTEYDYLL